MRYSFIPIILSITIAIRSITCITASILLQCPSSSPSRLSHVLQLRSYNKVQQFHQNRHHVYHMCYSLLPITLSVTSITIAIPSMTCITASILYQCPSSSPSRLSHAFQLRPKTMSITSFISHHLYHMHYSFNLITMSITIAIMSITCITASIL